MKKSFLVMAGIIIPLLLAEIILRLTGIGFIKPQFQFGKHTGARLESGIFVPDSDVFWREPSAGSSAQQDESHFIRIGDPVPPKSGKFRILCLGDSCTRLSGSNRPYSVLLENTLGSRQVEVFNASLPGYTSHQGLAWLKKQLLSFEPDLLIVYFGWNDHWRSTGIADRDYAASLAPGRPRLLSLWRPKKNPPPLRVAIDDYKTNLQEIARLMRNVGGQCLFILAPSSINAENTAFYLNNGNIIPSDKPAQLHAAYLKKVESLIGTQGIKLLDLADHFKTINERKLILMRDGIHPTEVGHSIIARILADYISFNYFHLPIDLPNPVSTGLSVLAQSQVNNGEWMDAVTTYRRAIANDDLELEPRMGLAWLLATCPADSVRNGALAVAVLEPIREKYADSPDFLYVRAATQAETGDFTGAVADLDQALELLTAQQRQNSDFAQSIRSSQDQYRRLEPYRIQEPSSQ